MALTVPVTARKLDSAAIDEAAAAIRAGKLVILPTETVYGLAARADDPAVVERVRRTKDRPPTKPMARLAADRESVERETGPLPRAARALADRYWPGPLTLVLPMPKGEPVGFRVPGLLLTREIVARAGVPVLATSANPSGGDEPVEPSQLAAIADKVDLVLDAGPTLLRAPSTVVQIEGPRHQLLREGFLSRDDIGRALARTFLFVCTGNTCRSPMAEAIMKGRLAKRLGVPVADLERHGYVVRSAGTSAMAGGHAAEQAVEVMGERDLELGGHRSRPLTPALVDEAEVIFVMSSSHAHAIEDWFPEALPKVRLLDPRGVPDPVGQSVERYRETADLIEKRIDEALAELVPEERR